ncbi:hypothetical protein LXL04_038183 [Taraxacum kok-saghyz]
MEYGRRNNVGGIGNPQGYVHENRKSKNYKSENFKSIVQGTKMNKVDSVNDFSTNLNNLVKKIKLYGTRTTMPIL